MKKSNVLILASLSFALATTAHAQSNDPSTTNNPNSTQSPQTTTDDSNDYSKDPLDTDRPDYAESPTPVAPGQVQIEAGTTYTKTGTTSVTTIGETLVRIGESNRFELRIGVPTYVIMREGNKSTSGFDDAYLGGKLVLSTSDKLPLTILFGTTLPTGSSNIGENHLQPDAVLATDLDLAKHVGLDLNVGMARPSDNGTSFTQLSAAASLDIDLSEKTGAYAELYGFNRTTVSGGTQKYFDTGMTYKLNPNLQLDARVGFGLNNDLNGPDYFYGVGVTKRY